MKWVTNRQENDAMGSGFELIGCGVLMLCAAAACVLLMWGCHTFNKGEPPPPSTNGVKPP